jgi:hypothetical protein
MNKKCRAKPTEGNRHHNTIIIIIKSLWNRPSEALSPTYSLLEIKENVQCPP